MNTLVEKRQREQLEAKAYRLAAASQFGHSVNDTAHVHPVEGGAFVEIGVFISELDMLAMLGVDGMTFDEAREAGQSAATRFGVDWIIWRMPKWRKGVYVATEERRCPAPNDAVYVERFNPAVASETAP